MEDTDTERTAGRDRERGEGHETESSALATIRAYYGTLRDGEALEPYFSRDPRATKFGITERLTGYEEIAEGLRTQTETTTDWTIESHALVVGERDDYAWFGDRVSMAWTEVTTGERHAHETRWSGTLERRAGDGDHGPDSRRRSDAENEEAAGGAGETDDGTDTGNGANADSEEDGLDWQFVSMHVSRSES